jgi:heme exporter protein A
MPHSTIYVSPRARGATDNPPPAVSTSELARLFGHSPALVDVSLRVEAGKVIALRGPNGAGKTTLLRILATAIRPSFGRAEVDGLDVCRHADEVRRRVAFLSHATGLYDDLTALENLQFAADLLGLAREERGDQVPAVLRSVGLQPVAGERVRGFSAGMRKRLALGRILLARPSLLLLDEPYASLDADGMQLVDRLLAAWKGAGVTCLVAAHAAEHLDPLVDGTVRLEAGLLTEVSGSGVALARPAGARLRPAAAGGAR